MNRSGSSLSFIEFISFPFLASLEYGYWYTRQVSWKEAESECTNWSGTLAIVMTEQQNTYLVNELRRRYNETICREPQLTSLAFALLLFLYLVMSTLFNLHAVATKSTTGVQKKSCTGSLNLIFRELSRQSIFYSRPPPLTPVVHQTYD